MFILQIKNILASSITYTKSKADTVIWGACWTLIVLLGELTWGDDSSTSTTWKECEGLLRSLKVSVT